MDPIYFGKGRTADFESLLGEQGTVDLAQPQVAVSFSNGNPHFWSIMM